MITKLNQYESNVIDNQIETEEVNIFKSYYPDENGKACCITNNKEGRKWMAQRSRAMSEIFANSI